jgi:hypothetical protein
MATGWANGQSVTVMGTQSAGAEAQVDIVIGDGNDRIRLPGKMLGLGHGEWQRLRILQMTSDVIDAKASGGLFNSPKVHIDRVTGVVSIEGKRASLAGACQIRSDQLPKF